MVSGATEEQFSQFHLFQHQVAGHGSIRQFEEGRLIKPAIPQEVRFYQTNLPDLAQFVPNFYGLFKLDEHQPLCPPKSPEKPIKDEFVILENICSRFSRPCVLDLKMGTRHYGEFADAQKRERAIRKCQTSTSSTLGFRICGMQVYHPRSDRMARWNKNFGRALNEASVLDAFRLFLWDGEQMRSDLIPAFLFALRNLLSVIRNLSGYRFYSSSLLLLYDGSEPTICLSSPPSSPSSPSSSPTTNNNMERFFSTPPTSDETSLNQQQQTLPQIDLRMIDFAKTYYTPTNLSCPDPDPGFVLGLESIIHCFEVLSQTNSSFGVSLSLADSSMTASNARCCNSLSLREFMPPSQATALTWSSMLMDDDDAHNLDHHDSDSLSPQLSRSAV
eukprot:c11344_g1_i1.p1 GENE.c11344_g1_i1~~c11344_g1_i1.p1  ORF type:complete len:388 (+),score=95.51 c11344_g1_i1:305-1468(+)